MINTFLGIAFESWVNIDGDCPMTNQVSASDAQLELGHGAGALHLVITQGGLHKLLQVVEAAAAEMHTLNVASGRGPQPAATMVGTK
jgi:hypothetical protein